MNSYPRLKQRYDLLVKAHDQMTRNYANARIEAENWQAQAHTNEYKIADLTSDCASKDREIAELRTRYVLLNKAAVETEQKLIETQGKLAADRTTISLLKDIIKSQSELITTT